MFGLQMPWELSDLLSWHRPSLTHMYTLPSMPQDLQSCLLLAAVHLDVKREWFTEWELFDTNQAAQPDDM